ncbi:hypothetical protein FHT00_000951 [Sphingomonas insulae]|uniref:DUF3617 family protein n=1 Tax=Sphingomonas insulae TaxID=424800 RepID=A0ABN1HSZ4_9SPHN|nr:hypothetical protein [Sphingomonas insulae]NIJ29018.1 hypothetical protein [Sphingomonas insulae]
MRRAPALALLLAACGTQPQPAQDTPGAKLEAAAVQAGLVIDPATASLVGSWALDTDRLCVLPAERDTFRIGALIDYGEGQGCAASGSARRRGDRVAVTFGACRFDATFDGDRIVFPAELPAACDRFCTGRASLAALTVTHLSTATSEAETLRTPSGRALCHDGE